MFSASFSIVLCCFAGLLRVFYDFLLDIKQINKCSVDSASTLQVFCKFSMCSTCVFASFLQMANDLQNADVMYY